MAGRKSGGNTQKTPVIGLVGCGHRGIVGFLESLKRIGRADAVGALCDGNPARLNFAWEILGAKNCRRYDNFTKFLAHPGMDTVIVATPDSTHAEIVKTCFKAGKHVVCEKPMATSMEDCRDMIRAQGNRQFRVAFNLRYNTVMKRVKELLLQGAVGEILQVESHDIVSWQHGSDYFRRWHRFMDKSGGLLVHKGTHNFDVVNWWVGRQPESVFARAAKNFYLPARQKGENCASCPEFSRCEFAIDLNEDVPGQFAGIPDFYRRMYVEGKKHDGYVRDACVFHRDNDVPDTYNVLATYAGNVHLCYTAVFFAPYEDRRFVIQGDAGRMEVSQHDRSIRILKRASGEDCKIVIPAEAGGHGGADVNLMRSLFQQEALDHRLATAEDGYWSVAIAAGANQSIRGGKVVKLAKI